MPLEIKYKTVIFFSVLLLFLIFILFVYLTYFRGTPSTLNVSPGQNYSTDGKIMSRTLNVGPGQTYSTDGINDQIEINNAINSAFSGDIVYLHTGIFNISAPINVTKNKIVIKGDGPQKTIIQASSYNAFYGTLYSDWYRSFIQLMAVDSVSIGGFTLKGVYPQIEPEHAPGHNDNDDSENGILLLGQCTNNKIHDINFTLISNNGIKVEADDENRSYNSVYNCVFNTTNHDCIEIWDACGWHIYNCLMNVTSDCGIRFVDSSDSEVSNCSFNAVYGSYANGGVYFQNNNENITIDWNVFHDMESPPGYGIYTTGEESGNITIHDNVFYNCPGGNIATGNITVTEFNNIFSSKVFDWTAKKYGHSN